MPKSRQIFKIKTILLLFAFQDKGEVNRSTGNSAVVVGVVVEVAQHQ